MFKTIKKHWRKSKNFNSAVIASTIVSFFFGKYISILLNIKELPIWSFNAGQTIILTIALAILLYVAYKIWSKQCDDLTDHKNFYDNYFISLVVVVVSTFMILYNAFLPKHIYWFGSLVIIMIIYFPLNWLFIKLRPK